MECIPLGIMIIEELIEMRDKAEDLATEEHLSEIWRRAYLTLAD